MRRESFDQWKRAVDKLIQAMVGLGADDLPDWRYRDAYDEGMTPLVAATKAVKSAKSF